MVMGGNALHMCSNDKEMQEHVTACVEQTDGRTRLQQSIVEAVVKTDPRSQLSLIIQCSLAENPGNAELLV